MSFCICLLYVVIIERYDVISIFQDGGHKIEHLLPGFGIREGICLRRRDYLLTKFR